MIATLRAQHIDGGLPAVHVEPAIANSRVQLPMPTSMLSPLDSTNVTPRRVPKLAVRSRSDETVISDSSQSSEESNSDFQHLPVRNLTSNNLRTTNNVTQTAQEDHSRNGSSGSQGRERPHRHQASKKKSAGVLGFLTLKEPSTSALEVFAEQEKRKAAQKGSKSIAMVMPGVSSQKLPDHVPKVNSKWDGLPETAKRKPVERKEKDPGSPLDFRTFSLSRSTSVRATSTTRPYGSLSSKPSIRKSQDKKRMAVEVTEVGADPADSFQTRNAVHPALRNGPLVADPSTPPDDLDLPDLSGYTITSPEASPRTPALDSVMPMPMPILGGKQHHQDQKNVVAPWLNEPDNVTVKSAGPNVLTLPRLRTHSPQPTNEPNYYPVSATSMRSTSTLQSPRTMTTPSGYSLMPPAMSSQTSSDRLSPLPSPSSASSTSSGMSAQWKSPPKERLSLGPQMRKEQVLPWEIFDGPPEDNEPRSTNVAAEGSKLKRFSYKLGRK